MGYELHTRVGWIWAPCQKTEYWGSVLVNETLGILDSDFGDVVEEGYIGVEGLESGE